MSRKSYRWDSLPITRTPTRRELEWAEERRAAGGQVDGGRGLFLMNGGVDPLRGHKALGDPIQTRSGGRALSRIGAAEARREDPYAYMDYQAIRDHLEELNTERGLGWSDVDVSRMATERANAAQERAKAFVRHLEDPRYQPGPSASKIDFMWDRPLEWDEQIAAAGPRKGPKPRDGRKTEVKAPASTRNAKRGVIYDKVVKGAWQAVKGGRSVRADDLGGTVDEEKPWRREYDDKSYITKNDDDGSGYTWFNADGSERGRAKDFKEYGEGGRSFFGDLGTGEGSVTIGSDTRNQQLVRNFKDDANAGSISYDTYQMRGGKEYKGASRTFSYGDGGGLSAATHTIRADYGGDNQVEFTRSSLVPGKSGEPPGGAASPAVGGSSGPSGTLPEKTTEKSYDPQMRDTKAFLENARKDMVTKTDEQLSDYTKYLKGGVSDYLNRLQGADKDSAERALRLAAVQFDRGGISSDALDKAKGVYADQAARAMRNDNRADLESTFNGKIARAPEIYGTGRDALKLWREHYGKEANRISGDAMVKGREALGEIAGGAAETRSGAARGSKVFGAFGNNAGALAVALARPVRRADIFARPRRRPESVQSDDKGGTSSRRDLFVDAVDPVAEGPDTSTVRGRIESLMGDRENAEYARIQKEFAQKKGRQMDVDTARLRALMGTGKLTRDDVMALGRELRAERDYSIASQLASQAVGSMPRDPMGYIVSQELDPGRRLGRDDSHEAAQRRVASVLNNGLRRDLSDAQRLFLAHRYNLVPEVRRVVSFDHAPGFGGEYGTVARGQTPLATYAPGSFYQPGTHRVLEAGSPELARAMRVEEQTSRQLGQLDSVDELFSRFTARHIADAARRVTSALRRKPEAHRALNRLVPLSSAGAPAMWWERTGTWAPAGRAYGIVDPNWRRIRAAGTNQDAKGGRGR